MPTAFYEPLGAGRFRATEHTIGPWGPETQHAGPPAALLARALERTGGWPGTLTRTSVDILGPIPVADVSVRTRTLRPGRSVELVAAELESGGRTVLRAQAWRMREQELALPASAIDPPAAVPPFPAEPASFFGWSGGYLAAMEWRWVPGFEPGTGHAVVWSRMSVPLVPQEEPTGLQRVLAAADSGSGISHRLSPDSWLFINTELTVHLAAVPRGEWICLDASTQIDPRGFGMATSLIYDGDGPVGRAAQTLMVGPRPGAMP